ncbi:MAG: T9SS type A sorting domain-containing protein [Candidatus Marinimicrobia bacterium]|nr:T9SS type A sorting domain-containing protein [Candidatus Neomarinimicrobiota bacterium]
MSSSFAILFSLDIIFSKQNYPNPFNPTTILEYSLSQQADVSLIVYNLLGEEVARLVEGAHQAGNYKISWDASNISSGIYFYRLQVRQTGGRASDFIETKKMLLLK